MQFHGPQPSMQQVRTPSRGWRSLRQVRRPAISKARHPDPERLQTQGLAGRRRFRLAGAWTTRVKATIPGVEISSWYWAQRRTPHPPPGGTA